MARLYTKKVWFNDQTKLSAKNLNHIEKGIEAVAGAIDELEVISKKVMTDDERNKLSGIAPGAQVNKIESIKVNGTEVNPDSNKEVNISVDASGTAENAVLTHNTSSTAHSDIRTLVSSAQKKADLAYSLIDGSPKGVYANLSALQTAYPSGASGVYLTSDNGHWYYWNGTAWTDGGVYQSSEDIEQIKEDLIDVKSATTFELAPVNIYDAKPGFYELDGRYRDYFTHAVVSVTPGDVLRMWNWGTYDGVTAYRPAFGMRWTAYNGDTVIPSVGVSDSVTYIVPNGVNIVKVGINTEIVTKPCLTLNKDDAPTQYEEYYTPSLSQKTDETLKERGVAADAKATGLAIEELHKTIKTENVHIVLPSVIYVAVGSEINIYYRNIIQCDNINRYTIKWSTSSGTLICRSYNECLRIEPTSPLQFDVVVSVLDKVSMETIESKLVTIKCISSDISPKNIMFIGDSLTDAGYFPAEIEHNLSSGTLTTIGTRSDTVVIDDISLTSKNEGRSGWTTNDYCNVASKGNFTNAFYNNGKFDFAYYMQSNYYTNVGYVVITLGTNDVADLSRTDYDAIIKNYEMMIGSIHDYNPNVDVILSLVTPSATTDGWGASNGRVMSKDIFDYYQLKLVSRLIDRFSNESHVYLSPNYININVETDFPTREVASSRRNPTPIMRQIDNVHPNNYGYLKMADVIFSTIAYANSNK